MAPPALEVEAAGAKAEEAVGSPGEWAAARAELGVHTARGFDKLKVRFLGR